MKNITLKISGMHCKSCEMLISDAVHDVNGVSEVNVSQKKGTATVTFDETQTTPEALQKAIAAEGYKVEQ